MRYLYVVSLFLMLIFGTGSLFVDIGKLFTSELNNTFKLVILITGLILSIGVTAIIFTKLYENLVQSSKFKSTEEFKNVLNDTTQIFALVTFLSLFSGGLFRLAIFAFIDTLFANLFGIVLILLAVILAFTNSVYLKFINQFKKESFGEY